MTRRFAPLAVLLAATVAAVAPAALRGGSVTTRDGKTYEGRTEWGEGGVVALRPDGGEARTFPLADVAAARFDRPPDTRPATLPAAAPTTGPSSRPAGWEEANVGAAGGECTADADTFTVRDTGKGMKTGRGSEAKWGADSLHLVYQRVDGDFEAVARVFVDHDPAVHNGVTSRAGVMCRESLDPSGPYVVVSRGIGGYSDASYKTSLQARADRNGMAEVVAGSETNIVGRTWLKLKRSGARFEAFESADGKHWTSVGRIDVAFTAKAPAYVGLASACGSGRESIFERPLVTAAEGRSSEVEPPQTLVFRDGTRLAAEVVRSSEGEVGYRRGGQECAAAARDLARVVLRPLTGDLAAKLDATPGPGLLLTTGDFVDGEFKGIADGRASVSSLLFGLRSFDADRQVAAVVWCKTDTAEAQSEVALADGSRLAARSLTADGDGLKVQTPAAGTFTLKPADIIEIRPLPGPTP